MSIVCIGWGSLIWDPRELPIVSAWEADGPMLPVEFARESSDQRITLVLVPSGAPVPTLWAKLGVKSLEEAKAALSQREGSPSIGDVGTNSQQVPPIEGSRCGRFVGVSKRIGRSCLDYAPTGIQEGP